LASAFDGLWVKLKSPEAGITETFEVELFRTVLIYTGPENDRAASWSNTQ
jgi:hypothetical protein